MGVAVITGSAGLIGSEAAKFFAGEGFDVVGIDNDMRKHFFGSEASTEWNVSELERQLQGSYTHHAIDIRDREALLSLFAKLGKQVELVIHCAAQPSHDWAAREPFTDFDINAVGTLNVLESVRLNCPDVPFIFTSTNKVYGDRPNELPLVELEKRWEIEEGHTYWNGIREDMSIDSCLHSLFGASKAGADILVQEYGRYFDMPTSCFRGGTLTGPAHSATQLHGFLAYLMRCTMTGTPYTVFGYKGKQVRDAIHSNDLVSAFNEFRKAPRSAEVYNIGGGRFSHCSMIEAIEQCEDVSGRKLDWSYAEDNRIGDHIWWVSDNGRFESHYPDWKMQYDVRRILQEIYEENQERWQPSDAVMQNA